MNNKLLTLSFQTLTTSVKQRFKGALALLFMSLSFCGFSQDILTNYEGLVDPLTGDFRWSQGVISIESTDGTSYPISIGYSAEVKTNQPASWVGLGWNLNGGEITRSVNGFPDDHKDYTQTDIKYFNNATETETTSGWGPMYFSDYSYHNEHTQDVVFSSFRKTAAPTISPAFDQFQMSSSLQGGSFQLNNYELHETQLAARSYTSGSALIKSDNPDPARTFDYKTFQMDNDPFRNTCIVYYTNELINTILTNPTTAALYPDFKEYYNENGVQFSRSLLDAEAIGAFTVILANGTKLHFSLPVLEKSSKALMLDVDEFGALLQAETDTTQIISKSDDFATSWKLTSITGVDYRSNTSTNRVEDGDNGYWLNFYYAKWFDTEIRTPEYGLSNNATYSRNEREETKRPFKASVSIMEKENYYLDRIESDREALVFYKSIRNDEYAKQTVSPYSKIPALKVSKIVRYYKEGLSINKSNTTATITNFINLNSNTTERNATYLTEDYSTAHNSKVIKAIEFNYDYSLQPNYYKNISNYSSSHQTSGAILSLADQYIGETVYNVPTTWGASEGKLSLIGISSYENEHAAIFDPFQFTYASGVNNPNYHHWNNDLTGNYMPINSRKQTRIDNNNTQTNANDFWKLKEIHYPNNTLVKVDYERDEYNGKYIGFNDPSLIIPIKDMRIISVSALDIATIELELLDANDKNLLQSKANRRINFWSHFTGCSGVTDPTYLAAGIITYNDLGTKNSSLSSMGVVSNGNSNKVTYTVPLKNLDLDPNPTNQSECGDPGHSFVSYPNYKYAYFTVSDPVNITSTHRVKELKVYESSLATDYYALNYQYENGYATNNLSEAFIGYDESINFGNRNTPFNSLPFNVLYKNTTIHKKAIDGAAFYSSKLTHHISKPFSFSKHTSNGLENQCYIPYYLLKWRVKDLWEYMNQDDYELGDLPELLHCGIRTYIENTLIPSDPNLTANDYSDWEKVSYNIPNDATLSNTAIMRQDGGFNTIYCSSTSVFCNGKTVDNNTLNVGGSLVNYYKYYTDENMTDLFITHSSDVTDLTTQLGTLEKLETFDGDGNLILETDYEYDVKAYTLNDYSTNQGSNTANSSTKTRTRFRKYYYYPKRKYIFSKGMRYVEEIAELHTTTGLPIRILYSDPSSGVSEEIKTLLVDVDDLSVPGRRAASKLQLGIDIAGEFSFAKRLFWQNGESWSTELSGIKYNHNLLKPSLKVENKLYGYQIGHYLSSGTNGLDELSTQRVETNYVGAIMQRDENFNYSLLSLNVSQNSIFKPLAITTQGFVDNEIDPISEQEITLINQHYNPLETHSITTDVYSSIRYTLNGKWPFVSMANCRLGSFTATGFEGQEPNHTYFEGEITGSANRYEPTTNDITKAHTGKFVCRVNNASPEVAFKSTTDGVDGGVLETGRTYVASVWVNNQSTSGTPELSVSLNGSNNGGFYTRTWTRDINHADNITIGDWTLIEVEFAILPGYLSSYPSSGSWGSYPDPELKISLTGMGTGYCYFDDFRFHPIESPMEVSIFDEQYARITHVLDSRNQYTELEYDLAGRIIRKIRESIHGVYTAEELTYND